MALGKNNGLFLNYKGVIQASPIAACWVAICVRVLSENLAGRRELEENIVICEIAVGFHHTQD